jgi:hypothetical protein
MYVESSPDESVLLVVLQPGWKPQRTQLSLVDGEEGKKEVLPLTVSGAGGRLQFTGREITPGEFRGVVTNLTTGHEGVWELNPLHGHQPTVLSEEEVERVRRWLELKVKLNEQERRLVQYKESAPKTEAALQHLQASVEEGKALREDGNSKYDQARTEFERMRVVLRKKLQEAKALEAKVELAHKVTKKGKLVSLSREAAFRENRWMQSVSRSTPASLSPDMQAALNRALRLQAIQQQIVDEQRRIERIVDDYRRKDRMELPDRDELTY